MELSKALQRLVVLETQGWDFHYTSCAIYYQGIITTKKPKDDVTYRCSCGRDDAIATVRKSHVGRMLVETAKK
jgi:hypothetical protein